MAQINFGSKNLSVQPTDVIFPLIYIILLFVLGYFIWKLVSPFISIVVSGIILYIHFLRDILTGSEE